MTRFSDVCGCVSVCGWKGNTLTFVILSKLRNEVGMELSLTFCKVNRFSAFRYTTRLGWESYVCVERQWSNFCDTFEMNGWLFSVQHLEEDKHHSSLIILESSFIIRSSWDAPSFIVHHSSFVILHSSFIIHHPSSFIIQH